jgi:ribosomal protein S18 acetylase RimI-like enzyme
MDPPASTRGVTLRAATLDDIPGAVALINRESQRLRGRDDVDETAVRGWWTQPAPFDLERNVVLAIQDGDVVGYGDLGDQANDGTVLWLDVRGDALAEVHTELEGRALERRAPGGAIRAFTDAADEQYAELLEERGYERIRASYRMRIDLDGRSFAPSWPEGARVRIAVEGVDEPLLHEVLDSAFADHWGHTPTPYHEWLHWLRELGPVDPSLMFVVEVDGAVAGAALCRPHNAGDPGLGWVSQLGILRDYRRRGLATALLTHVFSTFQSRGLPRVGLGVDAESTTGAVRLYENAGMTVAERNDIWERRA